MTDYVAQVEEGVDLSPFVLEFTDWIQSCFELLDAGLEDRILSDPFYERPNGKQPVTDEEIDAIVDALDEEYDKELGSFPTYHRNRSGANALPEFGRMSPRARRAMVEGIDRIIEKYKNPASVV